MINPQIRAVAEVNLSNLAHNFIELKNFTKTEYMIPVVKANAYGHGSVEVSRLYEKLGADIIAVACFEEAMTLRENGIRLPILILTPTPVHLAEYLAKNNIIQTVAGLQYASALSKKAGEIGQKINVHIKLDTGMTRLGIYAHSDSIEKAADYAQEITDLACLVCDGIFTHFSEAENDDTAFTDVQFENFMGVVELLKSRGITFKFCHCANSAAMVKYKRAHLNCVRPGLVLYGYSPTGEPVPGLDLRPCLTFKTLIADVRSVASGDSIGYNRTFIAERDMKIAVVSCGYADGVPRALSNRGYYIINAHRAPIVGRICMDLSLVDVTDIPDVKPFDEAVIFGHPDTEVFSLYDMASLAGTIPYELLTSISNRVVRTYITTNA